MESEKNMLSQRSLGSDIIQSWQSRGVPGEHHSELEGVYFLLFLQSKREVRETNVFPAMSPHKDRKYCWCNVPEVTIKSPRSFHLGSMNSFMTSPHFKTSFPSNPSLVFLSAFIVLTWKSQQTQRRQSSRLGRCCGWHTFIHSRFTLMQAAICEATNHKATRAGYQSAGETIWNTHIVHPIQGKGSLGGKTWLLLPTAEKSDFWLSRLLQMWI